MTAPTILLTGASGLIGRALAAVEPTTALHRRGNEPMSWDPLGGTVQDDGRPLGAVVHLAGEPIADGRWTEARKKLLRESRVLGTKTLVDWLSRRKQRPAVFVSASGINVYGDRGEDLLDEGAGVGAGFLAELCRDWEEAAMAAEALGVRVVCVRIAVVLAHKGGALDKMRLPFSLGLGGPIGSGKQWFPWIHLDDLVGVLRWALREPQARGAYNAVAPGIVRQKEFARAYGASLGRPAVIPTPAFALRALFGQMADEALLSSVRATPRRLLEQGFEFRFPELEPALADVVKQSA